MYFFPDNVRLFDNCSTNIKKSFVFFYLSKIVINAAQIYKKKCIFNLKTCV